MLFYSSTSCKIFKEQCSVLIISSILLYPHLQDSEVQVKIHRNCSSNLTYCLDISWQYQSHLSPPPYPSLPLPLFHKAPHPDVGESFKCLYRLGAWRRSSCWLDAEDRFWVRDCMLKSSSQHDSLQDVYHHGAHQQCLPSKSKPFAIKWTSSEKSLLLRC